MKIALIANPHAGGKKSKKLLPLVEKKIRSNNIELHTHVSLFHEHSMEIASKLNIKSYDAILAMGGDGTNFHVLNGLLSRFKPDEIPALGIIPAGSGNSFAKDLNIHNIDDAINAVVRNTPKKIDVGSFTQGEKEFYFINLTGLGFVTDVSETAEKFKLFKDFSYIIGVILRTISLHFHRMELEVDGSPPIKADNCFIEFCNSRFTGGDMMMAPEAKIDDGLMDIIIAGKLTRTSLLATLPKIFKGTHIHHPAVTCMQTKKARIKTWPPKPMVTDGELFGHTPATIRIHRKMIRYLT